MLEVKNISKQYHNSIVLNDVTFTIPKQSITGIIGPNGAGKTTLLNIITGFEVSDGGCIFFENKKLFSRKNKNQIFSYLSEDLQIYSDYLVKDFILFLKNIIESENEVELKFTGKNELIEILQLNDVMNKKIKYLSKGYHQRLKLFFALYNNKEIVFLDEPFNGFDPIQLIDILDLIQLENKRGRTFILSIHQLYDAEKICDYYILLNTGEVISQGSIQELQKQYKIFPIKNNSKDKKINNFTLEQIFIKALQ